MNASAGAERGTLAVTAGLPDTRQDAIWQRLRRRFFTSAGNVVRQSVSTSATSVTLTFPRTEADTSYGVNVTPSWNTTVWVSSRSTTGCTINFGTAAPASATIDVITFRSE